MSSAQKTWSIIKSILNKTYTKTTHPKQLKRILPDSTIKIITEKKEIANEFNVHYTTIASKLVDKIQEKIKVKIREKAEKRKKGNSMSDYALLVIILLLLKRSKQIKCASSSRHSTSTRQLAMIQFIPNV